MLTDNESTGLNMDIISWNMQGGSFANDTDKASLLEQMMGNLHVDFICVQGATEPLPSFSEQVETPSFDIQVCKPSSGHAIGYMCYFHAWGTRNNRCSLAVYTNQSVTRAYIKHYRGTFRPMLVLVTSTCMVGNVHLISGHKPMALLQFNCFREFLGTQSRKLPWFIVGDFNMDFDFISQNIPHPKNLFFHCLPGVATQQSGSTLDYVYNSNPAIQVDVDVSSASPSDHNIIIAHVK